MFGLVLSLAAAVAEGTGGAVVLLRSFARQGALRVGEALGAGFLLSLALSELLPEGMEEGGTPLWTLAGFLLLMLVEVWLGHAHGHGADHAHSHGAGHAHGHHGVHHGEGAPEEGHGEGTETHPHPVPGLAPAGDSARRPAAAALATWGGAMVCAFSDGISLASAGSLGAALGVMVFLGYMPHKLFEGFTMSNVLASGGVRRPRAAAGSLLLGASTVAGAIAALAALGAFVSLGTALCFSAGIMLYLAGSELIPELREGGTRLHLYLVVAGAAAYLAAVQLLYAIGLD